ncbi:helix-turn-helix transcriptional regulator [Nocardia otitidiscaviarum]|uniref:helix-turn-helix domain-containing protein n=1 Tax=Nocardia otitidiscaviarum TaxID=1823 RepID=UPI0004A7781D|nr:helix-turn-helix transcriptional regulator [Nocardia otitidiscaviarum]MBF6135845.1 helix-turn-helix transcriptional regulator [Nocardia otitidiscaviarum]
MSSQEVDRTLLREIVAAQLRGVLAEHGVTRPEVAARTGFHPSTIYRLTNAERPIELEVLYVIADAVGFDPGEFMDTAKRKYLKQIRERDSEGD